MLPRVRVHQESLAWDPQQQQGDHNGGEVWRRPRKQSGQYSRQPVRQDHVTPARGRRAGKRTDRSQPQPGWDHHQGPTSAFRGPDATRTLYFYVKNPDIGLPYFRAQGHEVELREGQASVLDVNGVKVELRRYHDEDRSGEPVKLVDEILKWPGAV